MNKTIINIKPNEATKRAAEFACQIQDAVNGRAILASLLRHLDQMREADDGVVGDLRNQHPVLIAVLDKLASLARVQNLVGSEGDRIVDAHVACDRLRRDLSVDWEIFPIG
jgi:hypothetical protein